MMLQVGMTALMWAASRGDSDGVEQLLRDDADIASINAKYEVSLEL
jgi:hypothetical protein